MDYIGKVLVDDVKIKTDNQLWIDVLNGSRQAVDDMLEYNKQDVILLEKVFDKLRPHIELGINAPVVKAQTDSWGVGQTLRFVLIEDINVKNAENGINQEIERNEQLYQWGDLWSLKWMCTQFYF